MRRLARQLPKNTSASIWLVTGVSVAALQTTVFPAASAVPMDRVGLKCNGKFHGAMLPTTP